ncbi:MAG TPA: hypothetical protein VKD90_25505 [Gemmataceae bacterium]|nr:hypothetical protein [Gemmataceae bacterium]
MATDQQSADLWRRVDASPPTWRDSPSVRGYRSYSGGDALPRVEGDVLRVSVRSFRPFVVVFACLFLPTATILAWTMITEPWARWLFGIGGPIVGILTFAITYGLLKYHERLGDYLVIDRAARTIALPRVKKEFSLSDVVGFQWVRGRSREDMDVEVDLNLLVRESGEVLRYHVMGNPSRRLVEQWIGFVGIPLEEIDLGSGRFRDADKDTAGRK